MKTCLAVICAMMCFDVFWCVSMCKCVYLFLLIQYFRFCFVTFTSTHILVFRFRSKFEYLNRIFACHYTTGSRHFGQHSTFKAFPHSSTMLNHNNTPNVHVQSTFDNSTQCFILVLLLIFILCMFILKFTVTLRLFRIEKCQFCKTINWFRISERKMKFKYLEHLKYRTSN